MGAIEYYGATTASFGGSLTPDLQDRQIASWLMGAPMVFSGDLASLSAENIARYHDRFALLKHLEDAYGICEHFQLSGMPSTPTETDWEWWGKLTPQGYGAVVVLRGREGSDTRHQCAVGAAEAPLPGEGTLHRTRPGYIYRCGIASGLNARVLAELRAGNR